MKIRICRPAAQRLTVMVMVLSALSVCCCTTARSEVLSRRGRTLLWGTKPIHLVGYSYYGLLADRKFDANAFLDTLAAHNINYTRFFMILPWPLDSGRSNLFPFAKSGGKYDLRKFDRECFARLKSIVKRAERLGIVCQVCLFDRCGLSISDRRAWLNNPYNGDLNVNGLLKGNRSGYPRFCQIDGPLARINAAFVRKVVQTIGNHGNVVYEIMNEPYRQLGPLPQWHGWVARELRKHLKDQTGSKVISSTGAYDDAEIDLFSMHMAGDERRVAAAIRESKRLNKPIILSDDGDWRSMFRPDVTRAAAKRALRLGQHFEHLEYTIALQREWEHRSSARLDEMSGLCRLNLRRLADLSVPLSERPFVRQATLRTTPDGFRLTAKVERKAQTRRIVAERSENGGRTWLPVPVTVDSSGQVSTSPLPVRNGMLNLARIVCIDRQSRRRPGPVLEYGPSNQWSASLGDPLIESGLFRVRPNAPDGSLRRTRVGGRACYQVDVGRRGRYAYFRLAETFHRNPAGETITIEVEYFDQPGGSQLRLAYDAVPGAYTAAAVVPLAGSGTWKTATWTVRDATFRHRQNDGADFRFSLRNPVAALAIRSVRVQRPIDQSPSSKRR